MSFVVGTLTGGLVAGAVRFLTCFLTAFVLKIGTSFRSTTRSHTQSTPRRTSHEQSKCILYFESRSRFDRLLRRLHALAQELESPSIAKPPPAVERIAHAPFQELMKKGWNDQIEDAVNRVRGVSIDWGHVWSKAKQAGSSISGL